MPICFLVLAVYLDLRDNRLTGTVPRELLELPNLRECSQATISYSLVAFTHETKKNTCVITTGTLILRNNKISATSSTNTTNIGEYAWVLVHGLSFSSR